MSLYILFNEAGEKKLLTVASASETEAPAACLMKKPHLLFLVGLWLVSVACVVLDVLLSPLSERAPRSA